MRNQGERSPESNPPLAMRFRALEGGMATAVISRNADSHVEYQESLWMFICTLLRLFRVEASPKVMFPDGREAPQPCVSGSWFLTATSEPARPCVGRHWTPIFRRRSPAGVRSLSLVHRQ